MLSFFFRIKKLNIKILIIVISITVFSLATTTFITTRIFTNTVAKNKLEILDSDIQNISSKTGEKIEFVNSLTSQLKTDSVIENFFDSDNLSDENFDNNSQKFWSYLSSTNFYKPYFVNKIIPVTNNLKVMDPLFSTDTYKNSIINDESFDAFRNSFYSSRFSEIYTLPTDVGKNKTISYMTKYLSRNTYEQIGYMIIAVKTSFIFEPINNFNNSSFDSIYIINRDEKIIYSSDNTEDFINNNISFLLENLNYSNYRANISNTDVYVFNSVISNYTDWIIVGTISRENIYSDIYKLNFIIYMIGLLFIILTIIVGNYTSKKITHPIRQVVSAMKEVEAGNWSDPLYFKTNDEIKELANGFNSMSNNIRLLIENIYKEQEDKKQAEILALEFQIDMLRYQINPHFIYNTINTIASIALNNNDFETRNALQSFSLLLKRTLATSDEFFTIHKEIECIKAFLEIQKLRYGNIFEFICFVDEEIKDIYLPRFSIQPLVENALFHGIVPEGKGVIKVEFEIINNNLKITVSDSGVGLKGKSLNEIINNNANVSGRFNNIGLSNINERLKIYYGDEYSLMLNNEYQKGTSIYFYIPIDSN